MDDRRLLVALILLFTNKVNAQKDECYKNFVTKILQHSSAHSNFVRYKYIDSNGMTYDMLADHAYIVSQIMEKTEISFDSCSNYLEGKLIANSPILFSEVGLLTAEYEINSKTFINKWKRKGRKKFLAHYFDGIVLKSNVDHTNRRNFRIFVAAYELGMGISYNERVGTYIITFKSDCIGNN